MNAKPMASAMPIGYALVSAAMPMLSDGTSTKNAIRLAPTVLRAQC
jgi:hypothetical protein